MKLRQNKVTLWLEENTRESKQKWKTLEHRRLLHVALASLGVFIVSVFLYLVIVPAIKTLVITKLLELRNGTHVMSVWLNPPIPFFTKVYIWNLTNAEDVAAGRSSPAFKEAGPYIYEQHIEKIPTEYKKNSIVYHTRTKFMFRADLSRPASQDDIVITLHAGLYGAVLSVDAMSSSMVPTINGVLPYLFPEVTSIFAPVRVGSYLFDGLVLNCSSTEGTMADMVCSMLPNYAPPNIRQEEGSRDYLYSFFAHKNNTLIGTYEEDRGLEDIRDVGSLLNIHNKSHLGVWQKDSQCDAVRGTDGYTFTPFIQKTDRLDIFIPDICQSVPLYYEGEDHMRDLHVYKFTFSDTWLGNTHINPENTCFCLSGKDEYCHNNGLRDISACTNAPVIMSLPHFYLGDEEFRTYARGMNPDPESHTSILYIEPATGTPIKAFKRIQFNMHLRRIEGFPMSESVAEGLFPLLWMEEFIEISDDLLGSVTTPLSLLGAVNILCIVLMVVALIVACCSLIAFLYLSRLWCFSRVPKNQITALFYKRSPESHQTKTDMFPAMDESGVHTLPYSLYPDRTKDSQRREGNPVYNGS